MNRCPYCQATDMYGVQYAPTSPNYHEEMSEWQCGQCGTRIGRWTHQVLGAGEEELPWGGAETDPEVETIEEPNYEQAKDQT